MNREFTGDRKILERRARLDGFKGTYTNGFLTYEQAWAIYWNNYHYGQRLARYVAKRNAR